MNILLLALAACLAGGQAGGADRRNDVVLGVNTKMQMPAYKTLAQWQARRPELRSQIMAAESLYPPRTKTPLNPRYGGKLIEDGYSIEAVAIETMPGFWLGGNLYRPKDRETRHPAIAHPHGHWKHGRLEETELCSQQRLGGNLARMGFVVFAYDMVGYNDTRQLPHEFGSEREQLWGFNPLAVQTWDSIRVVDFLQSLPDVDAGRIGVTGASGGGTQTFLLSAVDDRIQAAAPVNMVSYIMQGGCVCENAPGLRVGTNNVEIASLFAPKPMLLVSATGDWTKNVPREEFPAIQSIYGLFGRKENVEVVQIDAPHNYNGQSREAVYAFFDKVFLHRAGAVAEVDVKIEPDAKMLAWPSGALPEGAKNREAIFSWWQEDARRAVRTATPAQMREWLWRTLGVEWPASVTEAGGALSRPGRGDRVPFRYIDGQGAPALYLDPGGMENALKSEKVQGWLKAKRPVLLIDAFQTGAAREPRDRTENLFLSYNVSDDAARVQDVLTALKWLGTKAPGKVEIAAEGQARWWALFGAALSRAAVKYGAIPDEFKASDEELVQQFYVPHIQLVGGAESALRVLQGR
ncbi:MAG: alpha/beta hydrolase family protein [Bryobacteraceae bacterium]